VVQDSGAVKALTASLATGGFAGVHTVVQRMTDLVLFGSSAVSVRFSLNRLTEGEPIPVTRSEFGVLGGGLVEQDEGRRLRAQGAGRDG
jgi:hypothetical protein